MPRKGQIYRQAMTRPGEKSGRKYGKIVCSIRSFSQVFSDTPFSAYQAATWVERPCHQIDGALRGMVRSGSAVIVKRGKPGRTGQRTVYQLTK